LLSTAGPAEPLHAAHAAGGGSGKGAGSAQPGRVGEL